MNQYFNILGSIVVNLTDLDLPFIGGSNNGINQVAGSGTPGDFGNHQRFFIQLAYAGPDPDFTSTQTIVVFYNIGKSPGREIRHQREILPPQNRYGCINKLNKIMGKQFRSQAYRNTFDSHLQEHREFQGQVNRLFVTAVVRKFPFCGFGIKSHIEGKFREPGFNITRSG